MAALNEYVSALMAMSVLCAAFSQDMGIEVRQM
jgi:hypothetical protein